jgi:hypothetical protein
MSINRRLLLAAAIAGSSVVASFSANAFFGPFNSYPGWGAVPPRRSGRQGHQLTPRDKPRSIPARGAPLKRTALSHPLPDFFRYCFGVEQWQGVGRFVTLKTPPLPQPSPASGEGAGDSAARATESNQRQPRFGIC